MYRNYTLLFLLFFLLVDPAGAAFSQRVKKPGKFTNLLVGTSWKVNGIPFETKEREAYTFSTYDPLNFNDHWGYFINFDTTAFSTSYSAPCGNDCFTSVQGEYKFVGAFTINIQVNAITRSGFCSKKSETLNKDYGEYLLERTEQGWNVLRVQ